MHKLQRGVRRLFEGDVCAVPGQRFTVRITRSLSRVLRSLASQAKLLRFAV